MAKARKKASGRGGFRLGAGRKPVLRDGVRITVDLERDELEDLDRLAERRGVRRIDLIRETFRRLVRAARAKK